MAILPGGVERNRELLLNCILIGLCFETVVCKYIYIYYGVGSVAKLVNEKLC